MLCPVCKERAVGFFSTEVSNPFAWFSCESCGVRVRLGLGMRVICALTFCALGVSFCYTFPWLHEVIHERESEAQELALQAFLPYLVIPLQVILFFIPAIIYSVLWGRLEAENS